MVGVDARTEAQKTNEAHGERVSRVLFLGIGGTGKEILSRLKSRIMEINSGYVPPEVGFLLIDVDPSPPRFSAISLDPDTEFCQPGKQNRPMKALQAVQSDLERGGAHAWMAERVPPGEMNLVQDNWIFGTERYRQAGLLALLWGESNGEISAKIDFAIQRLVENVQGDVALSIFIVCSICGGTGSGMLIDVSFMARQLGLQHSAASCSVSGVLLLPHVFQQAMGDRSFDDLQRNALATLTELDFFMHSPAERAARSCSELDASHPIRTGKGDKRFDTGSGLMQAAFLIDNSRNGGGGLGGASNVFPAVADILLHLSGAMIGDKFLADLNNAHSTLTRTPGASGIGGERPHFSSLGLARVTLPVRRMSLEASRRLSEDVLARIAGTPELPSDAAVASAIKGLGLEHEAILASVGLDRPNLSAVLSKAVELKAQVRRLQKLTPVGEKLEELGKQRLQPEQLRSASLAAIRKAKQALQATLSAAVQKQSDIVRKSDQHVEDYLNQLLAEGFGTDHGLKYTGELLNRTLAVLQRRMSELTSGLGVHREQQVAAVAKAQEQGEDNLGTCRASAVKATARRSAAEADAWLNEFHFFQGASIEHRILENYVNALTQARESVVGLDRFLAQELPKHISEGISLRIKEWEDLTPVTHICVEANGLAVYESQQYDSVRRDVTEACLKSIGVRYEKGKAVLEGRAGSSAERTSRLRVGVSPKPAEVALLWVDHLVPFTERVFERQKLDDYIETAEEATEYARRCIRAADVFIHYDVTSQQRHVGSPERIMVVAPPANSRLYAAFEASQAQGVVAQDKDPTSAVVLRADVGILGSVLTFKEQAAAIEASMVETPGLWAFGQLSHNIFWGEPRRRDDLNLFFLALAGGQISKRPTPPEVRTRKGASFDYVIGLSRGAEALLGRGIQNAIISFLGPINRDHRARIRLAQQDPVVGERILSRIAAVAKEALSLIEDPAEAPSPHFRASLKLVLTDLMERAKAATKKVEKAGK